MEKKRIAIINSVYKIGSTGRICFELSNYLSNEYDVCTFYGRNNQHLPNSYYFGNKIDLLLHGLKSRITDKHGLYSRRTTKKLIKKLEEYKPDLILINNLHGYYVNYEILLTYLAKINKPVISVLHDCWNFTGHCAHFAFNGCDKWKRECKKCQFLKSYPKTLCLDNSLNNFKRKMQLYESINNLTLISPSSWIFNLLNFSFLKNKNKVLINNGIDLNIFKRNNITTFRNKYGLENKKLILCVSYIFDDCKGIQDIIKLSNLLKDDEIIVLVGKIKGNKKIPNNIMHLSQTNSVEELVEIYSSCDVFFNATHEDTFPNVNMEAMACGLPVICYESGGAIEMIDYRFAVKQGDLATSYKLIKMIFNKKIEYDFSNVKNFSKEITYEKYLNLIKDKLKDENTNR